MSPVGCPRGALAVLGQMAPSSRPYAPSRRASQSLHWHWRMKGTGEGSTPLAALCPLKARFGALLPGCALLLYLCLYLLKLFACHHCWSQKVVFILVTIVICMCIVFLMQLFFCCLVCFLEHNFVSVYKSSLQCVDLDSIARVLNLSQTRWPETESVLCCAKILSQKQSAHHTVREMGLGAIPSITNWE